MADSAAAALPALDNTMGVLFVGVVLAMSLWGAGSVQVYYYYNRYTKDELWIKCLVALVWIFDTTHQALITHTAYTYLVTQYGNPAFLGVIVPTLLVEVLFSAFIVFLVQGFFILRIWKLSHHNIFIVAICGGCTIAALIVSIVFTEKGLKLGTFVGLATIADLSRLVNILGAAADVMIAGSLIWLLQGSRTGFKKSDSIINRLIMFSLNTGLLTSLDAIASLVTITVLPTTFVYIMFYVTCSRLYTNSLMATLNSRRGANAGGLGDDSTGENSVSLSQGRFRSRAVEIEAPNTVRGLANNPHTLSIKVNTETETVRDQGDDAIKHSTPSESDTDVYQYDKSYTMRNV